MSSVKQTTTLEKINILKKSQLDSLPLKEYPYQFFGTTDEIDELQYLPLSGGTMSGSLSFNNGVGIKAPNSNNNIFVHSGGTNYVGHASYPITIRGTKIQLTNIPTYDNTPLALTTDIETAVANYLPLDGSKPMTGALDMNNLDLKNVNQVIFADPGRTEGLYWEKGNGWRIVECPNDISNDKGNIQFTVNNVRKATIDINGNFEAISKIMSKNTGKSERHYNNNSRVRPWHRIAYSNTNSNNYYDAHTILLISKGYAGGGFGIVELTVRCSQMIPTSSIASGAPTVKVNWLAHQGLAIADLAFNVHYDNTTSNDYGTIYKDVVVDVFYNLGKMTYDGLQVYELWSDARTATDRKWNFVTSYENTSTDYKECWATLEDAALELRGIAAKSSGTSALGGAVNYALQADKATKDGNGYTISDNYFPIVGGKTILGSFSCNNYIRLNDTNTAKTGHSYLIHSNNHFEVNYGDTSSVYKHNLLKIHETSKRISGFGQLWLNSTDTTAGNNGNCKFSILNQKVSLEEAAPSTEQNCGSMVFTDKNERYMMKFVTTRTTDGIIQTKLEGRNNSATNGTYASGNDKYATFLTASISKSGSYSLTTPNPGADSNGQNIATTAWVRARHLEKTVLWSGNSGTVGSYTLSESYKNFKYLHVTFMDGDTSEWNSLLIDVSTITSTTQRYILEVNNKDQYKYLMLTFPSNTQWSKISGDYVTMRKIVGLK